MKLPDSVLVTEVGMRDGLQMEPVFVDTDTKLALLNGLVSAGVRCLEATSFVSPRAVPQLADAAELIARADHPEGVKLCALAPNLKGVDRAVAARADEVVVFVSASESHNQKNLNRPIERSLRDIAEIAERLSAVDIGRKGAIAVAFGCPFEGDVETAAVLKIAGHFHALGFRHITLGDTTGMATPPLVTRTVQAIRERFPDIELSLHFHNTRGIGLVNVMAGLQAGVSSFEASLGGLGGCPFAPGASGNICTEDLVFLLHELGIRTGIDLDALIDVSLRMESVLGRTLPGQVMKSGPRTRLHDFGDATCAMG